MRWSNLQSSVIGKARRELKKKPWYQGVCTDHMPNDEEIKAMGFHAAVRRTVAETWYWDGQYYYDDFSTAILP